MTIWFDMDGTLNRFYDYPNWLNCLITHDTAPYIKAEVMFNMSQLAYYINKAQKLGFHFGIISWLSKTPNEEYDQKVTRAKIKWLKLHLHSVKWDEVNIVRYGIPKSTFKQNDNDILFDDEENNRNDWGNNAYESNEILNVLQRLTR